MAMDEQEFHDHVITSLAANTATLASIKENQEKGFAYFAENDKRIEAESRARDKEHDEEIDALKTKMSYAVGAGSVVGTGLGFFAKSLLSKIGIHIG